MLEFKRKKLEMNLYGEDIVMRYPTVQDRQSYQRSIQGLSTDKPEDQGSLEEKLYDFLELLGLPKEKAKAMYDTDLVELVNHLLPSKKK